MSFIKGNQVLIKSLRRYGEVTAVVKPGLYKVAVGSLQIQCGENDLEWVKAKKESKRRVKASSSEAHFPVMRGPPPRVDLHGMTVAEALSLVERRIDQAIREGADGIHVIHGRGTGRVRDAVQAYLKTVSVVQSFKEDPSNPGVTWVYF